jgi:hypothetical protein
LSGTVSSNRPQEHYGLGAMALTKKQGVSGQSIDPAKTVQLHKIEKDIR